jgi:hypothetical protein
MWLSVQDPGWFGDASGTVTWDRIPELLSKCEWVNEIMLGNTGFEVRCPCMLMHSVQEAYLNIQGTTFMSQIAAVSPDAFLSGIGTQLGEKSAELIGKAYNVAPKIDKNLFLTAGARWMGDVVFDGETHSSTVQYA